jgi:SAM-dependent methyltransferase
LSLVWILLIRRVWRAHGASPKVENMTPSSQPSLERWEQAEVVRSRVQASLTPRVKPTSKRILERYAAPPADTPYALEYAYHLLGDVRGQTVLDYGCGDGPDTALLAARGAHVVALDLSPELLDLCELRIAADAPSGTVQLLCGSAHAIPLPDESVDVVFGHAILHHLDLALSAAEVYRVLRPGGRAIFNEPIRESALVRAIRPLIPYRQPDISPYERPLRRAEVEEFGRRFQPGRARVFNLPFVKAAELLRTSKAIRDRSYALDARLIARYPALRTYASLIVFELHKLGPTTRAA